MAEIAGLIVKMIENKEASIEEVKKQVIGLCEKFPLYKGCIEE